LISLQSASSKVSKNRLPAGRACEFSGSSELLRLSRRRKMKNHKHRRGGIWSFRWGFRWISFPPVVKRVYCYKIPIERSDALALLLDECTDVLADSVRLPATLQIIDQGMNTRRLSVETQIYVTHVTSDLREISRVQRNGESESPGLNPSHRASLRYSTQRRRIPATLCGRALYAPHRANEEREKRAVFSARTAMCAAAARAQHRTREGAATPVDAQTALNLVPLLAPRGGAMRPSGVVGVFLRGGGVGARPARLVTHVWTEMSTLKRSRPVDF